MLDLAASDLEVAIHIESELHIAISETAEFLEADLSGDHQEGLDRAETGRQSRDPTRAQPFTTSGPNH